MEVNIAQYGQVAIVVATTVIGIFIAIFRYVKTETDKNKKDSPTEVAPVLAASFLDSRLIKELIDTLRETAEENARETKRLVRAQNELKEEICQHTEAVTLQTDATLNLLRFINRQQYTGGPSSKGE